MIFHGPHRRSVINGVPVVQTPAVSLGVAVQTPVGSVGAVIVRTPTPAPVPVPVQPILGVTLAPPPLPLPGHPTAVIVRHSSHASPLPAFVPPPVMPIRHPTPVHHTRVISTGHPHHHATPTTTVTCRKRPAPVAPSAHPVGHVQHTTTPAFNHVRRQVNRGGAVPVPAHVASTTTTSHHTQVDGRSAKRRKTIL